MTQNSIASFGVRRATAADSAVLMDFVPLVLAETSVLPLSDLKIQALVERCAGQIDGAIAGIIDGADGMIDASIGLAFTDCDTSDEMYIKAMWCGLHPSVRKLPAKADDRRAHYGRSLFEFAKWAHAALEEKAGHGIMMRFDVETQEALFPKIGLYQRNLTQIGATFALGASGVFKPQPVPAELVAA